MKTFFLSALLLCLMCNFNIKAYGQTAENLNLNKVVQPPYNCYGRLADGCPNAERLGWKVGMQFYSFHKYTFFEGIDLTRALGLHYIEATIGARISPESTQSIYAGMPKEWMDRIKQKLAASGVKCESIYYWMDGSGKGFEDVVKFCKEMGWMIVTDPRRANNGGKPVSFYEEILNKYGVKMAFTNHPKAASYWNPDFTVEDTKDYGPCIGASEDIGHYMRGGFDTYEIAKRYIEIGKMYHFHMRDVSERAPHGLDVPCGAGKGRLSEIFQALNDNNVKPLMMLEYEHDFDNPMPYLIQSVNYINEVCGDIIRANEKKAQLGDTIRLNANEAHFSKDMNLQGNGAEATIHAWNKPDQTLAWTTQLKPGNYQVLIRYAQPYMGSAMTLDADGQELATLFKPTFTWYDYVTAEVGVIKIVNGGEVTFSLHGIQNGIKRDKEGKLKANEALPDVHYLALVPTSLPATSQPVNVLDFFKGVKIFNGKNFDGWEGNDGENSMAHFRIEKHAIVGGSMDKDLEHNQFIRTACKYKNFELRLKYRVKSTDDNYNGGVQFRSMPCTIPGRLFEMVGYQADIISWKRGALYDEQRRWDFLGMQLAVPEGYEASKWNDYIIRCEGPRIRIWLNGVKTTDYIEPYTDDPFEGIGAISVDGYIALQIHEGKASEIWYKDIEIEELK
ncbi:family 16 glycoside hydrolase [Bacteroides thetaiotaomicron]|nr:family 16 glycoside hydrolase [Bacteroides thetaiotaomicron]